MDFDFFQQFKPKSMKEILDETKEKWLTRAKEVAESGLRFPWIYTMHVEDMDSPEFTLNERAHRGTQIRSYHVFLDDRESDVSEVSRTHDTFFLHEGGGRIRLGGGNDTVRNAYVDRQGDLFDSSGAYAIYGEDGNDRLVGNRAHRGYGGCLLDGGDDNDVLRSLNEGDELIGGYGSDHLKAAWTSDAVMTGGRVEDHRAWGDGGSNFFEIEVYLQTGWGAKTITDFSRNDKVRVTNRAGGALSVERLEPEVYAVYAGEDQDVMVATIHSNQDLFRIAEGGSDGEDLVFTGRSYESQFENSTHF